MSIESLYTHTAIQKRPTRTRDAMGGQVTSNATVTTFYGTLQPASGGKVMEFDKRNIQISHVFYSATGITVQTGDYLEIASTVYTIESYADQGGRGRVYAAYLLEKK